MSAFGAWCRGGRRLAPLVAAALLCGASAVHAADVRVALSQSSFIAGESATLDVIVSGPSGSVGDPELNLAPGLELLGSARSQNFSWVNGRSSNEIDFRYEIGAENAGRFRIGPVRVRVGNQTLEAAAVTLDVTSAPRQVSGATRGAASLTADVTPGEPWVGQPVILRVRLVQRATLAEAPDYAPPSTAGFWSERASDPETYYAQQGNGRVLVTETRTRLYPLAPGKATIGEATAAVVLEDNASPFSIFGMGQRTVVLKSAPVPVRIRALPEGAPATFNGAVGDLECRWTADRSTTAADVPFIVRLDVRGRANLPLIRTPNLIADGFDVFGGSLEDSTASPGSDGPGRRRFQWTVLPSRPGTLQVGAPEFAWFDTRTERYRTLDVPPIGIEVGRPLGGNANAGTEVFPAVFTKHPVDPGATPAQPWAFALAGALAGFAFAAVRRARPDAAMLARRGQCREWLRAVGLAQGPEFWQSAGEAAAWLESVGSPVGSLGREISASRYSGQFADGERIRRRLVELLSAAMQKTAPSPVLGIVAGVLVVTAVAIGFLFGPHGGDERERQRSRAADEQARHGDLAAAAGEWRRLWATQHPAGLAARLGWSDVRAGRIGEAAGWVLRGDLGEPRDPSLEFVAERVRESGGLTGGWQGRLPVRSLEWGLLAAVIAALGGAAWPHHASRGARVRSVAGLLLAALVAAAPVIERMARSPASRAVVLRPTSLAGADVELEAGQVVRIVKRDGSEVTVRVGTLEGRLPADVLAESDVTP